MTSRYKSYVNSRFKWDLCGCRGNYVLLVFLHEKSGFQPFGLVFPLRKTSTYFPLPSNTSHWICIMQRVSKLLFFRPIFCLSCTSHSDSRNWLQCCPTNTKLRAVMACGILAVRSRLSQTLDSLQQQQQQHVSLFTPVGPGSLLGLLLPHQDEQTLYVLTWVWYWPDFDRIEKRVLVALTKCQPHSCLH